MNFGIKSEYLFCFIGYEIEKRDEDCMTLIEIIEDGKIYLKYDNENVEETIENKRNKEKKEIKEEKNND